METASSSLHLRPPPSPRLGWPRLPPRKLQMWKRRRLKLISRQGPPLVLSLPFDTLFHGLLSAFPSTNSLDLIVPALGFASGAAFYFSTSGRAHRWWEAVDGADPVAAAVGEWILFTSPTPFNRCVLLRCPSVSFEDGGELLEGVNDRLMTEERHYVNLSRGRIVAEQGAEEAGNSVAYQRLCVGAGDGGVISLDWPENLELGREHGLDTTVLLVPGTPEGSMSGNVRALVHEALRRGCFPIVMNPRGCAGSPLTTPRLFTAADGDDINTAIQFINKSRPWATLLGIGWGYGANMLTKYLADVGERTPLTAAVCIDNPFDLNEATKALPLQNETDELTGGLVDILRANKELFQGKNRGFNVAKALSAKTVREFEGAISMISHGWKDIEDFYAKSSTKQLVHRVKIPLLFIQSDSGTIPLFSIPRNTIAENPFTSLLLCSCVPSDIMRSERSTITWCQNLAIEWLSAVELALLKGRHPLLKDVDITITPTKSIAMLEDRSSESGTSVGVRIHSGYKSYTQNRSEDFLKLPSSNATSSFIMDPISTLLEKDDCAVRRTAKENGILERDLLNGTEASLDSSLLDLGSGKEEGVSPADSERSQVLGTATVILNMLDVTMPGTLGDEQKRKVLTATEQGETFMKALEGAVPEDVRGKLMAAVSDIVHAQGNRININKLKKIGWVSSSSSGRKPKIQEQPGDISTVGGPNETSSTDYRKSDGQESIHGDSVSNQRGDHGFHDSKESSREMIPEALGYTDSKSEIDGKKSQSDEPEMAQIFVETSDKVNQNQRVDDRHEDGHVNLENNDPHYVEAKKVETIAEEKLAIPTSSHGESHDPGSSPVEHRHSQKEGSYTQEKNHEDVQNSKKAEESSSNHSSGSSPSISVSNALEALTGFDDSTQMAVNSVFGVIENMIDQLEKETEKNDFKEIKGDILESSDASKESITTSKQKLSNTAANNASNLDSDEASFSDKTSRQGNTGAERDEKKLSHDLHSSGDAFGRFPGNNVSIGKVESIQNIPVSFNVNPYWQFPYRRYFHRYVSAQMSNMKPFDLQSATDLFLDPDEGRWKMLDQMESSSPMHHIGYHQPSNGDQIIQSTLQETDGEAIIEPSFEIIETELPDHQYGSGQEAPANKRSKADDDTSGREELVFLVKDTVLDALKVEVARRLGTPDLEGADPNIMHDLERVSDAISHYLMDYCVYSSGLEESSPMKWGTIQGQHIVRTISCIVNNTSHLVRVLPIGVIVGSILTSLRKYFHVTVLHDDHQLEADFGGSVNIQYKCDDKECGPSNNHHTPGKKNQNINLDFSHQRAPDAAETSGPLNDSAMVGAVTAALGASALLAHHQRNEVHKPIDPTEISSGHMKVEESSLKLHDKIEEVVQEKTQNSLMSTLAEKAMSVAAPVVPTRNDGEVDHERLVATLAELGQKGGMLRLVGKVALLWGGIRGAMSLTDRLISFLHIAERPLFQRILGFVSMVLVMWSPVVIPLLPTLVECWTLKGSSSIAECACVAGLYVAIMILIVLWGRRIRGYENPLRQYGLDLKSASKIRGFLKGFIAGTMLVLYVHSVNALLGYACLGRPSGLPTSSIHAAVLFKSYGWMLVQTLKGVVTATCIAIVEELLFRSWLPEEIAVDLGYYRSIIISGVVFSLLQRSTTSIPGFFFLSIALFGAKQRSNGSLLLPIGIRTGILTTNFVVQTVGFLHYSSATPFWLASIHPWRPFDGIVGQGICILLAVLLYPRQPIRKPGTPKAA